MLAPGGTIGIVGGGQLGRMLALAAAALGYRTHIFTPEEDAPAAQVATRTTRAPYTDGKALMAFAKAVDVVTFEFENVPHESLEALETLVPVHPGPLVLKISRHRLREKTFINGLGIATAPFRPAASLEEVRVAAGELGLPAILKTCEMGYDGKGQATLHAEGDLEAAWRSLGTADAVLEGFVDFRMEISVLVACSMGGRAQCYVPVQNIHKHHMLDTTIAPAPISQAIAAEAQRIALAIAGALSLRGLLAIEMFVTRDDRIVVNELAPRPHNSGHWTMDACVTSQFEQAIRAVCGLPLGSPERLCDAEMKNLIGGEVEGWRTWLENPYAKLHLYGKAEARPGRKMGHVNVLKKWEE